MKKVKFTITVLFAIITGAIFSQLSINGLGNQCYNVPFTGITNTHYLGWNDSDIPLQFRTNNIMLVRKDAGTSQKIKMETATFLREKLRFTVVLRIIIKN